MTRPALWRFAALATLALLAATPVISATRPLAPGTYSVKECPPVVTCPPATVCPDTAPCPACSASTVTATSAAPPVCLQLLQPLADGADLHLGAAGSLADPKAAKVADWSPRGWRFWAVTVGSAALSAVVYHNLDDDVIEHVTKHKTVTVEPPDDDPPFCWPPGHCKD